jgi:hypothetical protein
MITLRKMLGRLGCGDIKWLELAQYRVERPGLSVSGGDLRALRANSQLFKAQLSPYVLYTLPY